MSQAGFSAHTSKVSLNPIIYVGGIHKYHICSWWKAATESSLICWPSLLAFCEKKNLRAVRASVCAGLDVCSVNEPVQTQCHSVIAGASSALWWFTSVRRSFQTQTLSVTLCSQASDWPCLVWLHESVWARRGGGGWKGNNETRTGRRGGRGVAADVCSLQ